MTGLPPGEGPGLADGGAAEKSGQRPPSTRGLYAAEFALWKGRRARLFLLCLAVFAAALVVSHVFFQAHPEQAAKRVAEEIQKLVQKGFLKETGPGLFLRILFTNARATLVVLALGLIPYLFLSAFGPLLNGGLVGMFTAYLQHTGFSLGRAVWAGLAPHGVFEVPALLYAAALGLDLSWQMTRKMSPTDAEGIPSFAQLLVRTLRSWILVILPLLVAAAAVEAFITPALLRL